MAEDRITAATVTPIAFPDPPLLNAAGLHEPYALRSIIQVRTASGRTGLGESYGDADHLALLGAAAGALTGLDVFDTNGLRVRVAAVTGGADAPDAHGLTGASTPAKSLARVVSPFEVAMLDVVGQLVERPVHALLGGKVRDTVPFAAYLFYKWAAHPGAGPDGWGAATDPAGIVAQARAMVDRYGFGSLKLKGGVFEPDAEIAAVRALRAAFPDLPVRIDPNAAWTVPTSLRVAAELAGDLQYLEDPTPGRQGMAEVAAAASMPLATNMCVVASADLPEAVRLGSIGVLLADHHYWGGLRASAELAALCDTFGIGLSMHSNSHLGISLAAMVHLAAATPNLSYPCDTHIPWADTDVVADPLSIVDGSVRVPDAPGLGVHLDPAALERLHRNYVSCGIRRRDDAGYYRRFEPDFTVRKAVW
jgi:glucarate dehydratase